MPRDDWAKAKRRDVARRSGYDPCRAYIDSKTAPRKKRKVRTRRKQKSRMVVGIMGNLRYECLGRPAIVMDILKKYVRRSP